MDALLSRDLADQFGFELAIVAVAGPAGLDANAWHLGQIVDSVTLLDQLGVDRNGESFIWEPHAVDIG
jgi:hypothetical protein